MNTWRVTLLLLIWRQNASYRRVASCGPSRSPLEFQFVATCCIGEFRPRSRCCCTPTSLCLGSHWKQGLLTNQPSTGVFARSLELRQDIGEEPMRRCRRGSSGPPTIEAGASCASVRREIRCFPAALVPGWPGQKSIKRGIFDQDTDAIRAKQWCVQSSLQRRSLSDALTLVPSMFVMSCSERSLALGLPLQQHAWV